MCARRTKIKRRAPKPQRDKMKPENNRPLLLFLQWRRIMTALHRDEEERCSLQEKGQNAASGRQRTEERGTGDR